jgi:hypothetical protein
MCYTNRQHDLPESDTCATRGVRARAARRIGPFLLGLWLGGNFFLTTLWAVEAPESDEKETVAAASKVDFSAQIRPILIASCQRCHGPEKRSGGLRLDLLAFAQMGGDSGKPIVGGTLETNELYRRVSSSDRSYRMPKNSPALSNQEIELFRHWVEQGTKWPDESNPSGPHRAFYEKWIESTANTFDRWSSELNYSRPYAIAFVLFQIMLLITARLRTAYTKNQPWAIGKARWFGQLSSVISPREMTLAWLSSVALMGVVFMRGHQLKISDELVRVQGTLSSHQSPWSKTVFGFPPKPIRPDHPKQVSGTYYRGNCERNPELFNNGNYLTATFRLGLCNSRREPIAVGDSVDAADLFVQLEIERAPGTSAALFSEELMSGVFLTSTFYDSSTRTIDAPPVRLQVVKPEQQWAAHFQVSSLKNDRRLDGLVYMYVGKLEDDGTVHGDPHFGIQYDLVIEDGKLSDKSDLWMNSFGNSVFAPPQPPDKLPYREWFDYRPMPIITGENTKDPKLLGVDEYVKKGLIKAPDPSSADGNPAASPPHKEE